MLTRSGIKAKYERLYAGGLLQLAKGDPLLAEKYLNEAALNLKEYISGLQGEEKAETREWFLELCSHIKEIRDNRAVEKAEQEPAEADRGDSFAFAKTDVPTVTFDDVVGLDAVKEQIYNMIIYPKQYKELYDRFQKKTGGGILLYGPPGNGKTMIAKAVAHETDSAFYPVKFSDLGSKWFGETESKIRCLFAQARRESSAVIFFDEIDALATKRTESSAMDRVVAELLTQIDGINRNAGNLTILAATNKPKNLDPAILRPGRFDAKIYVPLPDVAARTAMFEKRLNTVPSSVVNYAGIAALCDGFSGAEIELVCERAKQSVIRDIIAGASPDQKICEGDVISAIQTVRSAQAV